MQLSGQFVSVIQRKLCIYFLLHSLSLSIPVNFSSFLLSPLQILGKDQIYETPLNIVTWRLNAGMVEPEQTSIAEQRLGNHVSAATNINKD
jgi:hypothetical protein